MKPAVLLLLLSCGGGEPKTPVAVDPAPTEAAREERIASTPLSPCPVEQPSLGTGLIVERWPIAATPVAGGPGCIDVVRADGIRYGLRVLSAVDEAGARSAPAWRDAFHLTVVTNAGMFHASGKPVGMVIADRRVRSGDNTKMSGYLAWDPVAAGDPPVVLAGRDCQGFKLDDLRARYHSIVQSYRLLGCDGEALAWKDPKQYSAAAIGMDRAGQLVFLHARAAVTMAELSQALTGHDLSGALFLEGGPEASLVAHGPEGELVRVGSYESQFNENDANRTFWTLPNVIALVPR